MDAPLDGLACMHFALIYIDDNGKLRFEASQSIANNCQTILSPSVTENFLRAVALSGKGDPSKMLGSLSRSRTDTLLTPIQQKTSEGEAHSPQNLPAPAIYQLNTCTCALF